MLGSPGGGRAFFLPRDNPPDMLRLGHGLVLFTCAVAAAACAGTKAQPTQGTGGGAGGGTGGMAGTTGTGGANNGRGGGGLISVGGSTGAGGTGGACVPTATCTPPGGQYCGVIGNGCPGQK